MKIIRVFPRRTKATPIDDLARSPSPRSIEPALPRSWDEADEIHVSVAFTFDLERADMLRRAWEYVAPVKMGGPALGERSEEFVPGKYIQPGYTITSRGCPNHCWFCAAWKREGTTRELQIHDGWNILDDNLLACSRPHVEAVFSMLARQDHRPDFTGGLEAARLEPWHVEALRKLNPVSLFFAYDTPDDEEPARQAAQMLIKAGFSAHHALRIYVLCGWGEGHGRPADTMDAAEARLRATWDMGYLPMSMLWQDKDGNGDPSWISFNAAWANPSRTRVMCTKGTKAWAIA